MTLERITKILCDEFQIEEWEISSEASFFNDLDFDEIDIYDLVMSVEDEFQIELPDEELEKISTVGDLVKFIDGKK